MWWIKLNIYCQTVLWTISCLVACMYLCRREFFCTSNFTCAFFTRAFHTCGVYMPIPLPAQSIWCTLHALSITCAIHTPKMTITRSFITRALSHPLFDIYAMSSATWAKSRKWQRQKQEILSKKLIPEVICGSAVRTGSCTGIVSGRLFQQLGMHGNVAGVHIALVLFSSVFPSICLSVCLFVCPSPLWWFTAAPSGAPTRRGRAVLIAWAYTSNNPIDRSASPLAFYRPPESESFRRRWLCPSRRLGWPHTCALSTARLETATGRNVSSARVGISSAPFRAIC